MRNMSWVFHSHTHTQSDDTDALHFEQLSASNGYPSRRISNNKEKLAGHV